LDTNIKEFIKLQAYFISKFQIEPHMLKIN